jgi:hypothetical protein
MRLLESWVEALTVILDTSTLILTCIDGLPVNTAKFTFAMAHHAVVDLAQVLNISPPTPVDRLSPTEFTHLQSRLLAAGLHMREGTAIEQDLAELRATYEPFVNALAVRIQVSVPPWIPPANTVDDWQTSAWDDRFPNIRQTLNKVMYPRSTKHVQRQQ